jgi:hypothetical protein
MTRTKWMRLLVRDPADILRWAGQQRARHLADFRHRVIAGREIVSFRLVPDYRIQIGTHEIIVVAYVRASARQLVMTRVRQGAARGASLVRSAYAGAASAAIWSRPGRPMPINSAMTAAPMHISPDTMKASR